MPFAYNDEGIYIYRDYGSFTYNMSDIEDTVHCEWNNNIIYIKDGKMMLRRFVDDEIDGLVDPVSIVKMDSFASHVILFQESEITVGQVHVEYNWETYPLYNFDISISYKIIFTVRVDRAPEAQIVYLKKHRIKFVIGNILYSYSAKSESMKKQKINSVERIISLTSSGATIINQIKYDQELDYFSVAYKNDGTYIHFHGEILLYKLTGDPSKEILDIQRNESTWFVTCVSGRYIINRPHIEQRGVKHYKSDNLHPFRVIQVKSARKI